MTKINFLLTLRERLKGLPTEDIEKTVDYYLLYEFKDSRGNVLFSGTFDPGDVWNSDEIVFGAYGSTAYKSDSNTVCHTSGTKIYYESL